MHALGCGIPSTSIARDFGLLNTSVVANGISAVR